MAGLALGAGGAHAQLSGAGAMPATCKVPPGATLAALEARRDALQQEIARATGQRARKTQEQLLEVIFQIECVRAAEPAVMTRAPLRRSVAPAPGGAPPPAAPKPASASVIEVDTYYATSRKPTNSTEPKAIYGPEAATTLYYGRAVVTIPPTHVPGNLEMPTLWKLERQEDPNKHFVLKSVTPLATDAARKEMADRLQGMSSKALLVFVHGYNMTFADAALRTAQLAHDLRFPGMAFFYAWPSAAQILGYWRDEEMAQLSEVIFDKLIDDLSALPVTDIYVIAHSMGSRIVTGTLRTRVDRSKDTQKVRELLLAAPDINAQLFRTVVAPQLAALKTMRTTVYASSADLALRASKVVHGFQRVGESGGEIFIYPGFETIDASAASLMSRSYGHSYLMDSSSVLRDIRAIVEQKFRARQRGLREMGISPNQYWFLQ
jgi:esterase/lipase superfamily enzyme